MLVGISMVTRLDLAGRGDALTAGMVGGVGLREEALLIGLEETILLLFCTRGELTEGMVGGDGLGV